MRRAQRDQSTDVLRGVQPREGALGRAVPERGTRQPASRGVTEQQHARVGVACSGRLGLGLAHGLTGALEVPAERPAVRRALSCPEVGVQEAARDPQPVRPVDRHDLHRIKPTPLQRRLEPDRLIRAEWRDVVETGVAEPGQYDDGRRRQLGAGQAEAEADARKDDPHRSRVSLSGLGTVSRVKLTSNRGGKGVTKGSR